MDIKGAAIWILIAIFILVPTISGLFADLFWFEAVNYLEVFYTVLYTSVGVGLAAGISFLIFALVNVGLAKRFALGSKKDGRKSKKKSSNILVFLTLFFAFIVGAVFSNWQAPLLYLNATPFGYTDPLFGRDVGFYIFKLPFFELLYNFLLATLLLTILLTLGAYIFHSAKIKKLISFSDFGHGDNHDYKEFPMGRSPTYRINLSKALKANKYLMTHISVLLGLLFFVIAAGFLLKKYNLLLSPRGVIFGATYTSVNVDLPVLNLMMALSIIIGLLFLANVKIRKLRVIVGGIALLFGIGILGMIASGVNQAFIVTPNELNLEEPYINYNINNTLTAYNLENVNEEVFSLSQNLTKEDIQNNPETINNIRLWDFRPIKQTYNQLQLFRTYYAFYDVDIDRYNIDGNYKQVMVSPRELDLPRLEGRAQTWVNKHLVYTHGYGVVMNPVDRVSEEGLPVFFLKDIPPTAHSGLDSLSVERPEIYYGEDPFTKYSITNTNDREFDYPSGDQNFYTTYAGTGGVPLTDSFRRLIYASKFGSVELLVSESITPESKILLYKNVKERVRKIAPFLVYDYDPYIVISEGRLFWILDAYTVSNRYPYSETIEFDGTKLNYIRNSVKVVVDAYNGNVTFYVIDKSDPIVQTYSKIFPSLFTDFSEMPPDLQKHIRYPEDLFTIQAEIYSTYHMREPQVFYNKEDVWVRPEEVFRGKKQPILPYYVIIKFPGAEKAEFILMQPFSPRSKDNMIGWMAAKSDFPDYGELVVFRFSKQELTYGPLQIEARIDQNTEISQLFTLWGQAGSSVVRGNLLVIPIDDSILYVEPVFLEATERGTVPEMKRVIVAFGNRVVMEKSVQESLESLFGKAKAKGIGGPGEPGKPGKEGALAAEAKLAKIHELYNKAQEALKKGDLASFAQYIKKIGELL